MKIFNKQPPTVLSVSGILNVAKNNPQWIPESIRYMGITEHVFEYMFIFQLIPQALN